MLEETISYEAVSYTHLDVYKRQEQLTLDIEDPFTGNKK